MMSLVKRQKGFTLVELLAVIVILGVIAAIAIPAVGNIINDSKSKARTESLNMIQSAAQLYYVNEGALPSNIADLVSKGYLVEAPKDPVTGGALTVTFKLEGNKVEVSHVAAAPGGGGSGT